MVAFRVQSRGSRGLGASCTPDIRNAPSAGRASPTITSGTRGGVRSARTGPLTGLRPDRWLSRRRRASIAHESRRDPRSRSGSPCLHAAKSCGLCVIVFEALPSLCWIHAETRGLAPPQITQVETRPPGRWHNADRSAPAPQSKPVTPASRLVAQLAPSVASGLGLRILAAGPAYIRLYSYSQPVMSTRPQKFAQARASSSPAAGPAPARSLPAAEPLTETATPIRPHRELGHPLIATEPHRPMSPPLHSDDHAAGSRRRRGCSVVDRRARVRQIQPLGPTWPGRATCSSPNSARGGRATDRPRDRRGEARTVPSGRSECRQGGRTVRSGWITNATVRTATLGLALRGQAPGADRRSRSWQLR